MKHNAYCGDSVVDKLAFVNRHKETCRSTSAAKRVDVEYILWLKEELRKINDLRLEEIEFYEEGTKLDIALALIEDFEFIGLSNVDFITTNYYLRKDIK